MVSNLTIELEQAIAAAKLSYSKGQMQEAVASLTQALEQAHQGNAPEGVLAEIFFDLGLCHEAMQDGVNAQRRFKQALGTCERTFGPDSVEAQRIKKHLNKFMTKPASPAGPSAPVVQETFPQEWQDNIPAANIPGAAPHAPAYQAPAPAYQAPAPAYQAPAPAYQAPAPAHQTPAPAVARQAPPSQRGYEPVPPAPAWLDLCRVSDYERRTEQATIGDDMVNVDQLVHPREKFYGIFAAIISCIIYFLLCISVIGLLAIPIVYLVSYLVGCVYQGFLRSNSIRISPEQFPEVYEAAQDICSRMNMPVPQLFVSQEHGLLNAYAKRAHRKDIVVIYSSVFEMGYERGLEELKFVLAHELTHVKRGHVKMAWLRTPAFFVPFLGHAYSRACEYTCDRVATALVPRGALYGLVALASGTHLYKHVNLAALHQQQDADWDFWTWYAEILSTHPNLINRIRATGLSVLPDPGQWDDGSYSSGSGQVSKRRWENYGTVILLIGLSAALLFAQPPAHAKKEPRGYQRAQEAREARERAAEKSREERTQSADDSQQGDDSQSAQGTQQTDGDSSTSSGDQDSSRNSDESVAQLDAVAKQLGASAGKSAAAASIIAVEFLIIGLILINAAGGGVLGGLFICAIVYGVGKLFRGGRKPAIG